MVYEIKGQEWISANASLIRCGITVNQFLNGKIGHSERRLFDILGELDSLLMDLSYTSFLSSERGPFQVFCVGIMSLTSRNTGFQRSRCGKRPTRTTLSLPGNKQN